MEVVKDRGPEGQDTAHLGVVHRKLGEQAARQVLRGRIASIVVTQQQLIGLLISALIHGGRWVVVRNLALVHLDIRWPAGCAPLSALPADGHTGEGIMALLFA